MRTRTAWRIVGVALLSLALGACRSGYSVDVRNLTDQPVTARLDVPHTDGAPLTKTTRYIGPGDRGSLFVQTDYGVHATLSVDFAGNTGYPATLDLTRGREVVNVRRAEPASPTQGRLQLEVLPPSN